MVEVIVVLIAVVVFGAVWYTNRNTGFDANKDGKVDLKDAGVLLEQTAKTVVAEVKEEVQKVADVNKDGKVDKEDAKVVKEKVKTAAKKVTNRKPKAKPAAK